MEIKDIENKDKKMEANDKKNKFRIVINKKTNNERMKDELKDYIMDHRRLMYQRLEGMEPEPEPGQYISSENEKNINVLEINNPSTNTDKNSSNKKIGSNIVLFKKYVLGTYKNIKLLIGTCLGMAITWFGWAFSNNNFYSMKTYIICFSSYFLTTYSMILCFLTEPGIIPKDCPKYSKANSDQKKLEDKIKEGNDKDNDINIDNKDDNNEVTPRIFQERICKTCNIIRPPKTSHCRECDNCVQNFDHHCYFISNCVGKRNHKYFLIFLFFGAIGSTKMIILGIRTIYNVFIVNRHKTIYYLFYIFRNKLYIFYFSSKGY